MSRVFMYFVGERKCYFDTLKLESKVNMACVVVQFGNIKSRPNNLDQNRHENKESVQAENKIPLRKSGRFYIPHGHGKEGSFKPHASHIDVQYTECGPDWSSRLRWLPSPEPQPGQPKDTVFQPAMKSIRHFPNQHNILSQKEYNFYPSNGMSRITGKGKQTLFNNVHKASSMSSLEISDTLRFGSHGSVSDPRNGISVANPGDKPYQAVEYSPYFHKKGSTRPVVNFGMIKSMSTISLRSSTKEYAANRVKPYTVKEAERRLREDVEVVKALEIWEPAPPLTVPVADIKT